MNVTKRILAVLLAAIVAVPTLTACAEPAPGNNCTQQDDDDNDDDD